MPKGLLAEWRKGMVSRGLAAALLLAVPVGVAAAIGFEGSIGGLGEGLDALATGPDNSQAAPSGGPDPIDAAISALATSPSAGAPTGGGPSGPGPGGGGGVGGGQTPGDSPGGGSPGGGGGDGGGGGGGAGGTGIDPPVVDLPNSNPVDDLVDQVEDDVGGLLPSG